MNDKQQLAAIGEHMREMDECEPEFKVPDGWKLVPMEPTQAMVEIGCEDEGSRISDGARYARCLYKDMLAAAPEYKP